MKNNSIKTILLSLLVMALWGSLYPFIKIGYSAFRKYLQMAVSGGTHPDFRRHCDKQ